MKVHNLLTHSNDASISIKLELPPLLPLPKLMQFLFFLPPSIKTTLLPLLSLLPLLLSLLSLLCLLLLFLSIRHPKLLSCSQFVICLPLSLSVRSSIPSSSFSCLINGHTRDAPVTRHVISLRMMDTRHHMFLCCATICKPSKTGATEAESQWAGWDRFGGCLRWDEREKGRDERDEREGRMREREENIPPVITSPFIGHFVGF